MNATPKRPYKMIGKDGDAFVVCRPDKHGKNRTIAHIYEENTAYQFVRAVNSYDAMKEALDTLLQYAIYGLAGLPGPDHSLTRAVEKAVAALALAKGEQ